MRKAIVDKIISERKELPEEIESRELDKKIKKVEKNITVINNVQVDEKIQLYLFDMQNNPIDLSLPPSNETVKEDE